MTDELLIKFLLKEATEAEIQRIKAWLNESEANKTQLAQLNKIWIASKQLALSSKADESIAWEKFKQRTVASKPQEAVIRPLKPSYNWLKIAAMIAVVMGIWVGYTVFGPTSYTDLVASNEVRVEQLPDGSELTLNKHTALSYVTNFKKKRSVKLEKGDVFFSVAHDKAKPFVIDIDDVTVTVVGTSFNIKHIKDQTEVIVETGIVKVEFEDQMIELHKGEKVNIRQVVEKLTKETNKDQLYNYYRSKTFIANNIPLSRLVDVINEAYGAEIKIADEALAATLIVTTLAAEDTLEANLKIICRTLDLKMTRNHQQILLSNK